MLTFKQYLAEMMSSVEKRSALNDIGKCDMISFNVYLDDVEERREVPAFFQQLRNNRSLFEKHCRFLPGLIDFWESPSDCYIRWMIRRDMPEVLLIDETITEGQILSYLRQRNCIGLVATVRDSAAILGYVIYQLENNAVQILQLIVHPLVRGTGVGTSIINKLKSKLSSHRRNNLYFNKPPTESVPFLKARGFAPDEDRYIFTQPQ